MPRVTASIDAFLKSATAQDGMEAGITDNEAFREAIGGNYAVNVKDYGATGDGVTNDTSAFDDAITAAVAGGVKIIYCPPGEYVLGELLVPSGIQLYGAGTAGGTAWEDTATPAPVTRFFPVDAATDVLLFQDIDGNVVENIDIEYVSASVTSTGYGIRLEHATPGTWPGAGFWLRNSTIRNFARGLYSNGANRVHIENCKLVQNDFGLYMEGLTGTLTVSNSEMGGTPKDSVVNTAGQAWYLSDVQGAIFEGCEFGNCLKVGQIEGSSVVTINGANFETVSGAFAIGITTGRLSINAASCAAVSGVMVRNTGNQAGLVSFDGFTVRSGGSVLWDGRAVAYETQVANDFPSCVNTQIACRLMENSFADTATYWSGDRNPLPFAATPEIQRLELSAATASASANDGGVNVSARGMSLRSNTTAASSVVVNLSKGDVYAPVMMRAGDSSIGTFDWARRLVIRFKIGRYDAGTGSTSDNQAAVLFGVPYNRTTTGSLADKGIGIQISNTSVSAVVHNGSTGASVALGSIADSTVKEVVLDYDGAGTLKASLTAHYDVTRTGGPTGLSTTHANSVMAFAWNTTGGTSDMRYPISDLEIAYF